ncbi:MAG: multicopper oxidase domain-containing protein, partial [Vicinamibacterales bacterium]
AGVLRGNQLTLRLVARMAMWYPDGDAAPGAPVQAFAEEGGQPRIPGPLIRVRAGTEVQVTVLNAIAGSTLTIHGLVSRTTAKPPSSDSLQLQAGASRTLRLRLDAPGTYYYWGTTMGRSIDERTREDAQLTGAIIVDAAEGPRQPDRVFVIGMWSDTTGRAFTVRKRVLVVMNGRSWPHTERLDYAVGDTVHWRVINASADSHPMHLHGFYFLVDSRGDGTGDTTYAPSVRDNVVTDLMKPGTTMRMTWSPDRAGNWLFHCHLPQHFGPRGPLGMPPPSMSVAAHGTMNHALQGMNGLVLGVTVRATAARAAQTSANEGERRQMRLVVRSIPHAPAAAPNFQFSLGDASDSSAAPSAGWSAPPLVLTRGAPVSITVVNTLSEPTAVHWHGIELESYYDGVAGFSGTASRVSPVIAPGDSFVARFSPPRSGTFIYHTHVDEERQQPAGLAGPILVLDSGARYDPQRDLVVIATSPRSLPDSTGVIPRVAWLNGSATPAPFNWQVGIRYRIRFINMTTGIPGLRFELAQDEKRVRWHPLAKDGADLPLARQVPREARQPVSIGETADVEFVPESAGDIQLTVHLANGVVIATMPVRVRAIPAGKP